MRPYATKMATLDFDPRRREVRTTARFCGLCGRGHTAVEAAIKVVWQRGYPAGQGSRIGAWKSLACFCEECWEEIAKGLRAVAISRAGQAVGVSSLRAASPADDCET